MLISDLNCLVFPTDSLVYFNNCKNQGILNFKEEELVLKEKESKNLQIIANSNRGNTKGIKKDTFISKKDPSMICVVHDALNTFKILNPVFGDKDDRFGEFYQVAIDNQSENITKILEEN